MALNRREFLRKSGNAVALGASLMVLPPAVLEASALPQGAGDQDLERWLLGTGRSKVEAPVFDEVAKALR